MPQDNKTPMLRVLALLIPLAFAAAPVAQAKPPARKNAAAQATQVVTAPFPADATEHATQLNADSATRPLAEGAKAPAFATYVLSDKGRRDPTWAARTRALSR
jgi:hypothetical protein